jgi:hypothetical protein
MRGLRRHHPGAAATLLILLGLIGSSAVIGAAFGYEKGFDRTRVEYIDVPGPVQYVNVDVPGPAKYIPVDVPGPIQYVDVPGPVQLYEVDVVVPGPTTVKTVYVPQPRHCPSVADALNEYEALIRGSLTTP